MGKINFVALGILLVYGLCYMILFSRLNEYLRRKNNSYRKFIGISIAIIHVLFWWGVSFRYEEYMSYMIPPSIPFLIYSIQIAYGKIKI